MSGDPGPVPLPVLGKGHHVKGPVTGPFKRRGQEIRCEREYTGQCSETSLVRSRRLYRRLQHLEDFGVHEEDIRSSLFRTACPTGPALGFCHHIPLCHASGWAALMSGGSSSAGGSQRGPRPSRDRAPEWKQGREVQTGLSGKQPKCRC